MTKIINHKEDKDKCLFLFEEICKQFLFDNMAPKDQSAVREHVSWMKRNPVDLNVNCKLETIPELQMTRITLEYSHLVPVPYKNGKPS